MIQSRRVEVIEYDIKITRGVIMRKGGNFVVKTNFNVQEIKKEKMLVPFELNWVNGLKANKNLKLSSYGILYFLRRKKRNGIIVSFHPTMDSNGKVDTGFVGKTAFLTFSFPVTPGQQKKTKKILKLKKKTKKTYKKKEKNKDEWFSVPNVSECEIDNI